MKISQRGINLIKRFEGLELEAYDDGAGIWTIGYGHTGPDVQPGMTITAEQAEQLLKDDLVRFEQAVNSASKVTIHQTQFDALTSLAFNIGAAALKSSTAIKRMNKKDFIGAAEAITWWNKVAGEIWPGLVRRRTAEAELFLEDIPGGEAQGETRATPEENKPRRNNPVTSRTTEGAVIAGAGGAAGAGAAMIDDDGTTQPSDTSLPPDTDPPLGEPSDSGTTGTDGTVTGTQANPTTGGLDRHDYIEAFQIAAGVIVVLAVLYILFARFDDWFKWRR
ncbi:MAG: lysozyme [bacterium]